MSSSSSSNVLSLFLSTAFLLPFIAYGSGGFSVELIHRDSRKSPLYDPQATPSSRWKAAAERSRARAKRFRHAMLESPSAEDFYSEVTPDGYEYLMSFYIGSPAVKMLAIADTGSDLIWIQCKPCDECYHQKAPLFDPQSSSTYKLIPCSSDSCAALPQSSCGSESECEYNYAYGDGSFVDGFLSSETVGFDSAGGRHVEIPSTLFGCTHRSNGTFDASEAGLVGLGGGELSLIRQLGSAIDGKFSYCLPPYDQTSATSRLQFGSSASVSGPNAVTTPLIPGFPDTFYFLNLEEIIVSGQGAVTVKKTGLARDAEELGNIIIDSGTTLILIDDETLQSVKEKVASSVSLPKVSDPNRVFDLCFDVSGAGANAKFPDITFRFTGAPVVLHPSNAFVEAANNTLCLALVSSSAVGVNIFGNVAQQNFHIGYDLAAMQLTFAAADCAHS